MIRISLRIGLRFAPRVPRLRETSILRYFPGGRELKKVPDFWDNI
jgi:hypothetical protein